MIFHWTTKEKAITVLNTGKLKARRWQHFLEHQHRFAKGSSWSLDRLRWQQDNEVCLVLDESLICNNLHHINGHRTYLLTQGLLHSHCDPNAYLCESTVPDEVFIEGTLSIPLQQVKLMVPCPAVLQFVKEKTNVELQFF